MEGLIRKTSFIFLLLSLFTTINGLELVNVTESPQTVMSGESLRISCEADSEWQWCYWTNVDDHRKYHSSQGSASNETLDPRIQFSLSKFSCGLVFKTVTRQDSGNWKCHLANTDLDDPDRIKREAFVSIQVASRADVVLASKVPDEVVLGDVIDLQCSIADRDVFPQPTLSIYQVKESVDYGDILFGEQPLLLVNGSRSPTVEFKKEVSMEDDNLAFFCESVQTMEDKVVFHEKSSRSKRISLVFPPLSTSPDSQGPLYIFKDGSLLIPFIFASRPGPTNISWNVVDAEGVTIYPHLASIDSEDDTNIPTLFIESQVVASTGAPDQYYVSLTVRNITENVTATITVGNDHGSMNRTFTVIYLPSSSLLPPESKDEVQKAGLTMYIILAVVILLTVTFLLIFIAVCVTKSVRAKPKAARQTDLEDAAEGKKDPLLQGTEMKVLNQKSQPIESEEVHLSAAALGAAIDVVDDSKEGKKSNESPFLPPPPVSPLILGNLSPEANQLPKPPRSHHMSRNKEYGQLSPNGQQQQQQQQQPSPALSAAIVPTKPPMATFDDDVPSTMSNYPPGLEFQLRKETDVNSPVSEDYFQGSNGSSRGTLLRLSGPTNYPVFFPSPSPSGRRINQMNFMRPDN